MGRAEGLSCAPGTPERMVRFGTHSGPRASTLTCFRAQGCVAGMHTHVRSKHAYTRCNRRVRPRGWLFAQGMISMDRHAKNEWILSTHSALARARAVLVLSHHGLSGPKITEVRRVVRRL